jgi:lipopolysaccharide export LptBFGC system permease protein LptF
MKRTSHGPNGGMKVTGVLFVLAFVSMLFTPMAPDSQLMLPFLVVMWFTVAALAVLGVAYLVVGRGKP